MNSHARRRAHRSLRFIAISTALCTAIVLLPSPRVRTAPVPILEAVAASAASQLSMRAASLAVARSRLVRVNLYPLPSPGTNARGREDDIELELFPDVVLTAVFERFETISGSATWVGGLAGLPVSSVTLAYRDGLLTADVNTGRASYRVRPVAADASSGDDAGRPLHIVEEIDQARLPSGTDVVSAQLNDISRQDSPAAPADSGDVIDVMVVFTATAQAYWGGPVGIGNSIALAFAGSNSAYAKSGVTQRIRLVHSALVPYAETATKNWGATHLNNLYLGAGSLAGVSALRDAYGADLVALIYGGASDVCGIAHLSTDGFKSDPTLGVSAIWAPCLPSTTFPHELGHNMGLLHDWYADGGTAGVAATWPMPFARGHVDLANRWRTIMSYVDVCRGQGFDCPTINYFSNPDVEHVPLCEDGSINCELFKYWFFPLQRGFVGVGAGAPANCQTGVVPPAPCQADNRRALNQTARLVAAYRPSR